MIGCYKKIKKIIRENARAQKEKNPRFTLTGLHPLVNWAEDWAMRSMVVLSGVRFCREHDCAAESKRSNLFAVSLPPPPFIT